LWPTAVRVSLRPSDQRQPEIAFDGAAGFIVSWSDYRDLASDWRVQRLNYQGFRAWGLEGISVTSPAKSVLRIAPWGQGSLTMAWADSENGKSHIREAQINAQGGDIAKRERPAPTNGDQWNPVLAGSGSGRYWVGWEDNRNERNWQVYVRSGTQDAPLAPFVGDQGRLALAEDENQGVFAAWIDSRKGHSAIYGQHVDAAGQALWEVAGREISGALEHPETPVLRILGSGRIALVWADHPVKTRTRLYWQLLP
jgi:hypothetical protein